MNNCIVYQIFYDEKTRLSNDKGFQQLDNSLNERPDWSEYWPIRNFLRNNILDKSKYYGFFSPKFRDKTNLDSSDVYSFSSGLDDDVISYSPFFDQASFALNIFEQAVANHNGIKSHLAHIFENFKCDIDIFNMVMPSRNTIFCNYFIAKPAFWYEWFYLCEYLYSQAENSSSHLFKSLNAMIFHSGNLYPVKVFVIERIASYIIQTNPQFSIKDYNPLLLPFSNSPVSQYKDKLIELNSFKDKFYFDGHSESLFSFIEKRNNFFIST